MRWLRSFGLTCLLVADASAAHQAYAEKRPSCVERFGPGYERLPRAVYVPPLDERTTPYSLANPGELTSEHGPILAGVLDLAQCAADALGVPFAALRLTVIAQTDDRGAHEAYRRVLRERGVPESQIDATARAVVDDVAARHRGRIIAEQLQRELRNRLLRQPELGSIDPVGIVQVEDPLNPTPPEHGSVLGAPSQPHSRSFLVVIRARPDLTPAVPTVSPTPTPSGPSTIIHVPFCPICAGQEGSAHNHASTAAPAPPRSLVLGRPQLDALLGIAVAAQPHTRRYFYRELGWLDVGVRLPIRRMELGARLSLHASYQPIDHGGYHQPQLRLGTGATLLVGGLLLDGAKLKLALGIELGCLYLHRRLELVASDPSGKLATSDILAPQAAGWLRLSVPMARLPRLALSVEGALGVLPFQSDTADRSLFDLTSAPETQWNANLTAKLLGGITYALR